MTCPISQHSNMLFFWVVYFSVHKTWHVKAKKVEIYNKKEAFQNSRLRKQKSSGGNDRKNEPRKAKHYF